MLTRICSLLMLLVLWVGGGAYANDRPLIQDEDEQTAWREDLQLAVQRMEAIHPNLFWRVSEEEFRQQVNDLDAEIPYLTDEQITLGLASLAAHGGGHSYVWLLQNAVDFHLYPLRFYQFSDGVYVIDARDRALIGARLVQVGSATVEEAYEKVIPVISTDNDMGFALWAPLHYLMPEVLQAVGIIEDPTEPNFVLEQPDGELITYNPTAMSANAYMSWSQDWYVGLPADSEPLYLTNRNENFWYDYLEETQTLYIQYNMVVGNSNGMSISRFAEEIEAFIATNDVQKVVVDLRHNGGGNNMTYGSLLALLRSEAVNQPGRLFVITGRFTFSAAMNFVSDMEQTTEALFVGEPTGSRPNHYGDSVPFTLPNSRVVVNVAPQYLQDSTPDDTRPWVEPDIPVVLSSADFFAQRDPVLEAILSYSG